MLVVMQGSFQQLQIATLHSLLYYMHIFVFQYSQWTLCRILHAVQRALLNSKAVMKELAAENAALMEQTASKELPDDLLVSTMFMVKCDMVEALEFARASQKMFHAQHMKSNRTSKEHEETRFLTEILHTQRMEIEKVKKDRNMEQDHFNDMKRYCVLYRGRYPK